MDEKTRRALILEMFNVFGSIHGRTFLQKIFYVLDKEEHVEAFEYIPYHYGPYSKQLNNLVSCLVSEGMVEEKIIETDKSEYYLYKLTETGKQEIKRHSALISSFRPKISALHTRFQDFKPIELLKYVYRKYPASTVMSIYGGER